MFTFRRNSMYTDYEITILSEALTTARKNFLTLNCTHHCNSCKVRMACIDLNSLEKHFEKRCAHYAPNVENENTPIVK